MTKYAVALFSILTGASPLLACQGDLQTTDPDLAPRTDRVCEARIPIAGTFSGDGSVAPLELEEGCWPFGTWTVTLAGGDASEIEEGCEGAPLGATYEYSVESDPDEVQTIIASVQGAVAPLLRMKQAGDECQGTFEHFSDDRREVLRIKTFASGPGSVSGTAYFEVYKSAQM